MVVVFILARGLKDAAPCGVIKDGVEFICIIDDEGVMVIVGPLFIISLALVLRTLTLVTLVKSRSDWVTSLGRWPFVVKEPLKNVLEFSWNQRKIYFVKSLFLPPIVATTSSSIFRPFHIFFRATVLIRGHSRPQIKLGLCLTNGWSTSRSWHVNGSCWNGPFLFRRGGSRPHVRGHVFFRRGRMYVRGWGRKLLVSMPL